MDESKWYEEAATSRQDGRLLTGWDWRTVIIEQLQNIF